MRHLESIVVKKARQGLLEGYHFGAYLPHKEDVVAFVEGCSVKAVDSVDELQPDLLLVTTSSGFLSAPLRMNPSGSFASRHSKFIMR